MMTLALILAPLAAALLAWRDTRGRLAVRLWLPLAAVLHLAGSLWLLASRGDVAAARLGDLLGLDMTSAILLTVTSTLFLCVSLHTQLWLPAEQAKARRDGHGGLLQSHRVFVPCLLLFLSTMTLVISARNFGLLWVAVEATTLASAPLILFHRSGSSLEAMWKYLLICSVGIGLALFGTMLMAVSATGLEHGGLSLSLLAEHRAQLHPGWFKAAFILILVGYGTKMGLAPFHTWLPDAHSEAPGVVSALLSGALLNCSLLGIWRFLSICPDGLLPFCRQLLVALGLLSLAVAVFFIIHQPDYKRMLAYSSVEHMGLAAILCGIGRWDVALLHLCGHSLIKMSLFLLAGNVLLAYGTRAIRSIGGMFGRLPRTALLWLVGVLLICGTPPSPLFVSEWLLLTSAPLWLTCLVFLMLFGVFAGMSLACLKLCLGEDGEARPAAEDVCGAERAAAVPAAALGVALLGGAYLTWCLLSGQPIPGVN